MVILPLLCLTCLIAWARRFSPGAAATATATPTAPDSAGQNTASLGAPPPWRHAVIVGATLWSLLLVVITEALSTIRLITPAALAVAWAIPLLAIAILWWMHRLRTAQSRPTPYVVAPDNLRDKPGPDRGLTAAWCAGIVLLALTIAAVAWIAPPDTWDSMTYHMPRVAHWRQNQSVAHYPTHSLRQLWMQPAAEYAVLHFQVLTGGDRLANFVQWLAMAGSVVAVSLVAGELGAGRAGQALAAVFVATLPMGIVQASGTQTDYVAAFFLVCLAYFILRLLKRTPRPGTPPPGCPAHVFPGGVSMSGPTGQSHAHADVSMAPGLCIGSSTITGWWFDAALAGAALGLAALTKATNVLFALPLLVWLAATALRRRSTPLLAAGALMAILALAINLPFLARNHALFGHALGPVSSDYRNARLGPSVLLSNLVRNAALHLNSPSEAFADQATRTITHALASLGIDASDPATSYNGQTFAIPHNPLHEDLAGNPIHLLLALIAVPALLLVPRLRRHALAVGLALAVVAAVLLYCTLLRWQLWANRLELPLFVLIGAPVAVAAEALRPRLLPHLLAPLLLLAALPWALSNQCRPLINPGKPTILSVPRRLLYFANAPQLFPSLDACRAAIRQRHIDSVGLIMDDNDGEYLLWSLLQGDGGKPVRIEHVDVQNVSRALERRAPYRGFVPAMTIRIAARPAPARPPRDAAPQPSPGPR